MAATKEEHELPQFEQLEKAKSCDGTIQSTVVGSPPRTAQSSPQESSPISHDDDGAENPPSAVSLPQPAALIQSKPSLKRHSAFTQIGLVAILSFLGPGMWNALNGIGGAGLVDAGPANEANIAVYTTSIIGGFLGGMTVAKLGLKFSFIFGDLGYALYTASLLVYKHAESRAFIILAGVALGFLSSWFWTAQAFVINAYPSRGNEGKAIGWWTLIYNSGACIGSLVAFLRNRGSSGGEVDDASFYAILTMSVFGSLLATMICSPNKIEKADNTQVEAPESPTWKEISIDLIDCIKIEWHIVFLFPMFFASNFFYPYQFNTFNLKHFSIRTRSLNNIYYWAAEVVGALLTGYILDIQIFTKSIRAPIALLGLFLLTCGVWTSALVWQEQITPITESLGKIDYTDHVHYVPGAFLYAAFGLLAAAYTTVLYWLLKALCHNDKRRMHLGGFYKGVQAAGGALAYRLNISRISPTMELTINWTLLALAVFVATPMVLKKVRDDDNRTAREDNSTGIA